MAEDTVHKGLLEPILEQGIRNTHFFNGRLLTALDLKTEQDANRRHRQQLGQAIGAGVVRGLEVRLIANGSDGQPPVVAVSSGLALNRVGQAIDLPVDVKVTLARQSQPLPVEAGLFAECVPPKNGTVPTGKGIYVLASAPASGFREKVPMRGLGEHAKVDGCGSRYAVEGVRFRWEELELQHIPQPGRDTLNDLMTQHDRASLSTPIDPASLSTLRNLLAHLFLGTEERAGFPRDPLRQIDGRSPYTATGALETLYALGRLTDCDVPLAVVYWTTTGVQFADMGAVRRRAVPATPSPFWPLAPAGGYPVIGEAISLQFQEHVADLTRPAIPQSQLAIIRAIDYFRYLPAAGIVPLTGVGTSRGVDYLRFVNGLTYREPAFIAGARLEALLRDSLAYPPIDLNSREAIWLYLVRENIAAIATATSNPPLAYIIFASGHMPFLGEAQYDLSYFDYANYA